MGYNGREEGQAVAGASRARAGTSLPPYPAALTRSLAGGDHIGALRDWGHRIGLAARDALAFSDAIELGVGERSSHVQAVSKHFGLGSRHHSLRAAPLGWLRMSETQATKGLRHFLADGNARLRLFLRALAPSVAWPDDLRALSVEAETASGRGRIDLIIRGEADGRVWGAVVEAKFEHGLKGNPLGEYSRHGARLGMALRPDAPSGRTGALVVLGSRLSRQTRRKLTRNPHWRFVHWREVLRRFDAGLDEATVDDDFRRFRRTLWDRAGS